MTQIDNSWLAYAPSDWKRLRVKQVMRRKNSKAKHDNPVVLSLARTGVKVRDITSNEGQLAESYENYNLVEPDDILLNPMDLQSGANCSISRVSGVISPAYVNLRPNNKRFDSRFFDYYFKTQYWSKAFFAYGKGVSYDNRWTLNAETVMNYPILVPDSETQKKVADYIDAETAQIDNLIAKQERLLELLEEKRRATITHAVTRGLNPSVELKETNIPWLGQIPAHWSFERNKYRLSINKGLNITKADLIEKGVPVISYGQVHSKYPVHFDPKTDILPFVPESYLKIENAIMRKGDFIFADTSEDYEGSGNFSMLKTDSTVLAGYHSIVARLTSEEVVPEYQAYYFASEQHRNQIRARVSGVKVFSISQSIIANAWSLLPPKEEQEDIAQFLDIQEQKTKELKQKIQTQIALLRERRTSLISHAVTGKVKV